MAIYFYKNVKKMNIKNVAELVMKLYLYSDMCKMIHYSAKKMHEHTQSDDVLNIIRDYADRIAENCFGFIGKPTFNDFSLEQPIKKANDLTQICQNVFDLLNNFEKKLKNPKYSGIQSIIDEFKSSLSSIVYLNMFDKVSDKKLNECINKVLKKYIR